MNILIVSAVFPPEPVVSSLISFDIASRLSETGNSVTVICPPPTRPFGYNFSNNDQRDYKFKKIILDSYACPESKIIGRFRESYSFGKHCSEYIRKNHDNIEIIYANTWPLFAQFFLVKAAKRFKIKVALHIQDVYPESFSEKQTGLIRKILLHTLVPFDRYVLKNCSRVIAISPNMRNYLIRTRRLDFNRTFVVRNWQNDEKFLPTKTLTSKSDHLFTFMYLGSINPSASVVTLINAFGKAKLVNARLIIAGEGSEKSECIKAASLFQEAQIEFVSAPVETVADIQQQADVLLLPLKRGIAMTASPSKLAAYMFSGKPILACVEDTSDTAVCIQEARCGWVVEPENEDTLASLMKDIIISDRSILGELGNNSRSYAEANMSRRVNLEMMTSIILQD